MADLDFRRHLMPSLKYHDLSDAEIKEMLAQAIAQWGHYANYENLGTENGDIVQAIMECIELRYIEFQYGQFGQSQHVTEMAEQITFSDVGRALAYLVTMNPMLEEFYEETEKTVLFSPYDLYFALDSVRYAIKNFTNSADLLIIDSSFHYYMKELSVDAERFFEELLSNLTNRTFVVRSDMAIGISLTEYH